MQQDSSRDRCAAADRVARRTPPTAARFGTVRAFLLLLAAQQRRRVFLQRRKAARLAKQNLLAARSRSGYSASTNCPACARASPSRPCEISGRPQQPGLDHIDAAPAALQNFHRGDADFRIVVIGERVVEQRDAACRVGPCVPATHCSNVLRRHVRHFRRRSSPSIFIQPRAVPAQPNWKCGANRLPQPPDLAMLPSAGRAAACRGATNNPPETRS